MTTDITIRCDMDVELVQSVGTDNGVAWAARVSTQGGESAPVQHSAAGVRHSHITRDIKPPGQCPACDSSRPGAPDASSAGLINYLMKNRHGTPFEHNSFTFLIRAPIFVWREFHRHRVGFSYNEESGRYKKLEAEFYVPGADRKLVQTGKPGYYQFEDGTDDQRMFTQKALVRAYREAYRCYEDILTKGVAREVARMCLPLSIYSSCYVTCNARSLMSFLSLRTSGRGVTFPSFPQREIAMVADKMEAEFGRIMPITLAAFTKNGRVSP